MSKDDEVGYGKPPRQHRFKPGNQAARGGKKPAKSLSLPDLFGTALNRRRKIKRGNQVVTMKVGEILIEKIVQMASGTPREVAMVFGLLEKYAPRILEQQAAKMEVTYHQAEGSQAALPPADLWDKKKR